MAADTTSADDSADVLDKARDIKFAMVTTHDDGGELRVRPLTVQQVQDDGTLWFFVDRSSHVAADVTRDPRASMTFADAGDSYYVAMSGRGHLVRDSRKVDELWNAMAGAWFPGGQHDPELLLLRVDIDNVEYWKPGDGGKLMQFASIAKAALTHEPPQNAGEHGSFAPRT